MRKVKLNAKLVEVKSLRIEVDSSLDELIELDEDILRIKNVKLLRRVEEVASEFFCDSSFSYFVLGDNVRCKINRGNDNLISSIDLTMYDVRIRKRNSKKVSK